MDDIKEQGDHIAELSDDQFYLKVYSPFKIYFDGAVQSVSAVNDTGPFDILASIIIL
jgi:hypothetical protein